MQLAADRHLLFRLVPQLLSSRIHIRRTLPPRLETDLIYWMPGTNPSVIWSPVCRVGPFACSISASNLAVLTVKAQIPSSNMIPNLDHRQTFDLVKSKMAL